MFSRLLLVGLNDGFKIGYNHSHVRRSTDRNIISVSQHPDPIKHHLDREIAAGWIIYQPGRFKVHKNRFCVIPKLHQSRKCCLITNLSAQEGFSANDNFVPSCTDQWMMPST